MKKKFIAVNLTSKKEHLLKMSFFDDVGNEAFQKWWFTEGAIKFMEWVDNNEYFRECFTEEGRDYEIIDLINSL